MLTHPSSVGVTGADVARGLRARHALQRADVLVLTRDALRIRLDQEVHLLEESRRAGDHRVIRRRYLDVPGAQPVST